MGEGSLVTQTFRVVAGRHQERTGGLGAHAVASHQLGGGGGDKGLQDGIQLCHFVFQLEDPLGQQPQRVLCPSHGGRGIAGTQPSGATDEAPHGRPSELHAQLVGAGEQESSHLVEGLDPGMASGAISHPKSPDGLDISVLRLRLGGGVAREHRLGRSDGVYRVRLAVTTPALAVGAAHLHDLDGLGTQEAGVASRDRRNTSPNG